MYIRWKYKTNSFKAYVILSIVVVEKAWYKTVLPTYRNCSLSKNNFQLPENEIEILEENVQGKWWICQRDNNPTKEHITALTVSFEKHVNETKCSKMIKECMCLTYLYYASWSPCCISIWLLLST